MLRGLLAGARWLGDPDTQAEPAGWSGISQARTRLGAEPLEALYRRRAGRDGDDFRRVVSRVTDPEPRGHDVRWGDTAAKRAAFGGPARARVANATGAFPQLRLVGLLETGTHVLCAAQLGAYATGEVTLAADVVLALTRDMLGVADRGFLGCALWQRAAATGAQLVWRAPSTLRLPVLKRYADGSYRSALRWNSHGRSADRTAIAVRVIEYTLDGAPDADTTYRLVTSILEPVRAPAPEMAAMYHERWEIETAFDAFKTHQRGARRVLRSKTPDLVQQEAWGFLLAHFAIRALMHEAALGALPRARDPDSLSFVPAVRVIRRTLPHLAAIPPLTTCRAPIARSSVRCARRRCPRGGAGSSHVGSSAG